MLKIAIIFFVFYIYIASSVKAGDNLVLNGSFEITDATGTPFGWKIQRSGDASLTLEEDAYAGEKAFSIETHKTEDAPERYLSSEIGTITQNVPITPQSCYLLSFWYRFDHKSGDELKFYIFGEHNYLSSFTEWTRAMKVFESGSEENLDLMIQLYLCTSKVWIDVVKLIKLKPNTNYLSNPGFDEVRKDGAPVGWKINVEGSPTIKIENTHIYGDRCLSVEGHPGLNAPKGYPTSDRVLVSQPVPLKTNTFYDLSFWYRTTSLSDRFKVEIFGESYSLPDSFEWVRKTITINSKDNDNAVIRFVMEKRTGKVWINNVEFLETIVEG